MNIAKVKQNLHIKPIVANKFIKDVDPFEDSYIWNPQFIKGDVDLMPFKTILAKSYYGHPALFKPSIAEVINAIPEDCLKDTVAFQINGDAKIDQETSTHIFPVMLYRKFKG